MAKKRKESESTLEASASSSSTAGLVGATLVLAGLVVAAFFGWTYWAEPKINAGGYLLVAENVQIPETPTWIRSDVRAEVFRDGSLANASSLETDLTPRVAHAFEMHPWVAEVTRVSKRAKANVIVELTYRRPIAWVEVPDGMFGQQGQAALPIDGESVLLPQADFTEDDLGSFIRIDVHKLSMSGPTGTPWGDPRVAGAAKIARMLGDEWKRLGLYRIRAVSASGQLGDPADTWYELQTPEGKRLIWGSVPGSEPSGELPAEKKLNLLREYVRRLGPLDDGNVLGLDLRNPESIRTALLPR